MSCIIFRSLNNFKFIVAYDEGIVSISLIYMRLSSFPNTLVQQTVFSPLYIISSFFK